MTNCRQLKVLLVNNNRLKQLFKGCSNLKSLHTLDISQNKLTRLSRGLGGLYLSESLKNFDLSGNEWEMPPDEITSKGEQWMLKVTTSAKGPRVSHLLLAVRGGVVEGEAGERDQPLQVQPVEGVRRYYPRQPGRAGAGRQRNLHHTSIYQSPETTRGFLDPEKQVSLSPLSAFLLLVPPVDWLCRLTEIPEELWNLRALSVLKLDDNKITSISRNIVRLASTLTWFSIERNFVTSFPVEFAQMEVHNLLPSPSL